jgi:hypothetical protein
MSKEHNNGNTVESKTEHWKFGANPVGNYWDRLTERLAGNSNPLSGVISDQAFCAVKQEQAQAVQRMARVLIADLDGADGAFDGVIQQATLQRKAGVLAQTFGFSSENLQARIKELPVTLSTEDLNARVGEIVSSVQHGLPCQKPIEQRVIQ